MNTELMQSYRAVHCARCNEPIPVSTKVAGLFDEIEHCETMLPYAFTARCVLCEYESVYAIGDIREVQGTPRRRRSKISAMKEPVTDVPRHTNKHGLHKTASG